MAIFVLSDSIWESRITAVHTYFSPVTWGGNISAIANIKLWRSLGIGIMFGVAANDAIPIVAVVLLAMQINSVLRRDWQICMEMRLDSEKYNHGYL